MAWKKLRWGVLSISVSLIAIYLVLSQIHLSELRAALAGARYAYLLPCVLFLLLGLVTRGLRWQALLNYQLPLWRAFSIMNIAYLVNGVLPLRLGEVARVYLASQVQPRPVAVPQTLGSILIERLLDLMAVVLMVFISLAFASVPLELRAAGALGFGAVVVGLVGLLVLAKQRTLANYLLVRLPENLRPIVTRWASQFLDGLMPLTRLSLFVSVVGWTVISWVLSVIAGYWLMFAFFPAGDWVATMLYIASAAFVIAVPAVPGNLGTYEASIWLVLTVLGYVPSESVVAFALVVHAVNVLVHAATGVLGFIQEGLSLGQLTQGVQALRDPLEVR